MITSTHVDDYMHSRHGKSLSSAAGTDFSNSCRRIFGFDTILDGELVLPTKASGLAPWYVIWDMPVYKGRDLLQEMYITRLALLNKYHTDFKEFGRVRLAHNIWMAEIMSIASLDAALQRCDGKLIEGVVGKNLSSSLNWSRVGQLDCSNQVKFRVEDLRPPTKPESPKLVS